MIDIKAVYHVTSLVTCKNSNLHMTKTHGLTPFVGKYKLKYFFPIVAASTSGNGNTAQHPRLQRLLSFQQKAGKKPSNGHGQSGGCCIESDQLLKRRQSLPITPQKNSANSSCANVPDVIAEEEGGAKITGLQNSGNCTKTKTTPKRRSSFPALRRNSCKVS